MKYLLILCIIIINTYAKDTINVAIPKYSDTTKNSFEKIAKDYEKLNPNIKINIQTGLWKDWQFKIQKDFFSNKNADIIYTTRAWLPSYAKTKQIEPLDSYLNESDLDNFDKSLLNACRIDGKLYALPSVSSARNLYVNLDILKKINKTVPKTWDELKEVAKLVTKQTNKFGFGIQGDEVELEKYFYYILWNFKSSILDKTVNGKKSMLYKENSIKALEFYVDMIKNKYTQNNVENSSREDIEKLFLDGKISMIITFGKLAEQINKSKNKINFLQTNVPSLNKNEKGYTLGVIDAVHLSSNSKHKKEAIKFLLYFMEF